MRFGNGYNKRPLAREASHMGRRGAEVNETMTEGRMTGGCLCGSFRFEVTGPLGDVRLCHCDLCRAASGTAFSANARVPLDRFAVLTGKGTVKEYQSSPGAWRAFCSSCGSPAYGRTDRDPNHIRIRLGTLPRTAEASITAHVWVGSKAAWDSIAFDVPKYLKGADGALMASDDLGPSDLDALEGFPA